MDYDKHIAHLEAALPGSSHLSDVHQALTAAIALMKAAAPRSAEQEREHCERFANEWLRGGDGPNLEESVAAERAAARAEGDTAGYTRACLTRVAEVEIELSAAKAEIETLQNQAAVLKQGLARAHLDVSEMERQRNAYHTQSAEKQRTIERLESEREWSGADKLEAKLSEARAEIERLRAEYRSLSASNSNLSKTYFALETKFSNLRAEVKRILDVFPQDWYAALLKAHVKSR
jgi:DNA repair exonuclease SbcCD ATPase subunit